MKLQDIDWRSIVGTVAPALATALGGPLAGTAAQAISQALFGRPDASEDEITAALKGATPQALLDLKKADQEFKVEMGRLGVALEKIAADDRANARERQAKMNDWTPTVLGAIILAGFFAVLLLMIFEPLPPESKSALDIMLGVLGTISVAVVQYIYGSSAGSARKTELIGLTQGAARQAEPKA